MKKIVSCFIGVFLAFLVVSSSYADCRGCCSGRGGLECVSGVTRCVDGTPLSQNCLAKSCDVCPDAMTTLPSSNLRVASFNIQVFGRTKASKPEVMEILSEIIRSFDLIAVQEIRDTTGSAINKLEAMVDGLGINYGVIIGPRLGRTSSKEQYAFLYNTKTVTPEGSYTYKDNSDSFHREPFSAKFKAVNGSFDFVVINIHVDPDDAMKEINALPAVIDDARQHFSENDVILLGDFNADCTYFDEERQDIPLRNIKYKWLIKNDVDTTVASSSCTYDRIIITSTLNEDLTGQSGVFKYDDKFEMDCQPKEVSDHYPVYTEFKTDSDTD